MPELVWLRGESSVICTFSLPLPPHVQGRLDKGDLVRVSPDGSVWVDTSASEPEDVPPPDAPPLPKRSASRAVWQKFAMGQGMDRGKAALMSRDELVTEFTRECGES